MEQTLTQEKTYRFTLIQTTYTLSLLVKLRRKAKKILNQAQFEAYESTKGRIIETLNGIAGEVEYIDLNLNEIHVELLQWFYADLSGKIAEKKQKEMLQELHAMLTGDKQ